MEKEEIVLDGPPCGHEDCDNWLNNPKLCRECMDTSITIELDCNIEE